MYNINLLNWRQTKREEQKKIFFIVVFSATFVAFFCMFLTSKVINIQVTNQKERLTFIENHLNEVETSLIEIEDLKKKRALLLEKIEVINSLQSAKTNVPFILSELTKAISSGVFLESMKYEESSNMIHLDGSSETNHRISDFMRNLKSSPIFTEPNLTSLKENIAFGEQASRFKLTVKRHTF